MSHTRLPSLALATIMLATTAGCGKSASSSTQAISGASTPPPPVQSTSSAQTGPPLSRTELITKADAVCGRISAKRNLLRFSTSAQLQLILPKVAAYQQALLAELSKLTPPASMTSDWNKIVADARVLADSIAKVYHDSQVNNASAARPLFATFAQARRQLQITARRAGFKDCATY